MRIRAFGTQGLFGIFNHHITLNQQERVTIIDGPNGFGKTTLLRLLRDFFGRRFNEIAHIPFSQFYVVLEDGKTIVIGKKADANPTEKVSCRISLLSSDGEQLDHLLPSQDFERYVLTELQKRAPYIEKAGQDLWEDTRDGELLDNDELVSRYGLKRLLPSSQPLPDWLSAVIDSVNVRLIETQRLIFEQKPARRSIPRTHLRRTATVIDYAQQLAAKIQVLFNQYARLSQQLDRTFVVRLLKRDFTVREAATRPGSLREKVENLNQKRLRLMDSGLLSQEEEALPLPEDPNYMIDQILTAYLQDVESKLAVFDTLLGKIELLKTLVDAHLEYKKIVISQQFGIHFKTTYGRHSRVLPASLSSGEQHILILFYDLLFDDSENSVILIDEPEISLHVDWQLSFLTDLHRIVSIAPHDIVLATHSPQIINNRWDLTVPLHRPEDAQS